MHTNWVKIKTQMLCTNLFIYPVLKRFQCVEFLDKDLLFPFCVTTYKHVQKSGLNDV